MRKFFYLFFMIILLVSYFTTYAQNVEDKKYSFAKSFEQAGDYETASRMYKELFESNPQNKDYFDAVVRTYKGLFKFSELKPLIELFLEKTQSVESYSIYAEILWRLGSIDSANIFWEKAIEKDPNNLKNYKVISESQIEVRQFDKAIKTLLFARNKFKKNNLFAEELSELYIATGSVNEATIETINILKSSKNLALAQGRLSALMVNKDNLHKIQSVLEKDISYNDEDYLLLKLYSWFLRSTNRLDNAFEITIKIDNLINADGREILSFANNSRNDGQFDIALKAYEYLISLGNNNKFLSTALYGYSRTLEQKMLSEKKFSKESARKIIENYKEIIEEFPDNIISSDAALRIAVIYLDYLNELDKAKVELQKVINKFKYTLNAGIALNLLGKIHIQENNFKEARKTFITIVNEYTKYAPDEVYKAKYLLAELLFFEAKFDSAQVMYADLVKNINSDVANDALERIYLLEENKNYIRDFTKFSKEQLLILQNKKNEAIEILEDLIKTSVSEDLSQRSLYEITRLTFEQSQFDSAIYYGNQLIENYEKSIFADKVILLLADSYVAINRKDEAINILKKLLVDYPNSVFLQEARNKIKALRTNI